MTEERLPLAELLAKAGDGDFLRSVANAVLQLRRAAYRPGVDDLMQAMGLAGVSKSTVSKLRKD